MVIIAKISKLNPQLAALLAKQLMVCQLARDHTIRELSGGTSVTEICKEIQSVYIPDMDYCKEIVATIYHFISQKHEQEELIFYIKQDITRLKQLMTEYNVPTEDIQRKTFSKARISNSLLCYISNRLIGLPLSEKEFFEHLMYISWLQRQCKLLENLKFKINEQIPSCSSNNLKLLYNSKNNKFNLWLKLSWKNNNLASFVNFPVKFSKEQTEILKKYLRQINTSQYIVDYSSLNLVWHKESLYIIVKSKENKDFFCSVPQGRKEESKFLKTALASVFALSSISSGFINKANASPDEDPVLDSEISSQYQVSTFKEKIESIDAGGIVYNALHTKGSLRLSNFLFSGEYSFLSQPVSNIASDDTFNRLNYQVKAGLGYVIPVIKEQLEIAPSIEYIHQTNNNDSSADRDESIYYHVDQTKSGIGGGLNVGFKPSKPLTFKSSVKYYPSLSVQTGGTTNFPQNMSLVEAGVNAQYNFTPYLGVSVNYTYQLWSGGSGNTGFNSDWNNISAGVTFKPQVLLAESSVIASKPSPTPKSVVQPSSEPVITPSPIPSSTDILVSSIQKELEQNTTPTIKPTPRPVIPSPSPVINKTVVKPPEIPSVIPPISKTPIPTKSITPQKTPVSKPTIQPIKTENKISKTVKKEYKIKTTYNPYVYRKTFVGSSTIPQPVQNQPENRINESSNQNEPITNYTVTMGDSLSEIAKNYLGDANRWLEIYELNKDIISNPDIISIGMILKMPLKERTEATATYIIKSNDSLSMIAKNLLGDVNKWVELYELNKDIIKNPDIIEPGMSLQLPVENKKEPQAPKETQPRPTEPTPATHESPVIPTMYEVKPNDSLSIIAKNVLGDETRYREIYELNKNRIMHPSFIYPGQKLKLPLS